MRTTWGFDLETYLFQPGLPCPRIVCGSWADEEREWIDTREGAIAFFVRQLEAGNHLVGVNLAFDIGCVAVARPDLLPLIFQAGNAGQFHCCSIREALHDIAVNKLFINHRTGKSFAKSDEMGGRYSMAILMDRHFGEDISADKVGDVWRYKYATLDGVPISEYPEAARTYPLRDARRTYDIWKAQAGHRNLHDEPAQMRAAIAIELMRIWGFRTDGGYLAQLDREVDALWDASRAEFAKAGIFRADGTKDTAVLKAMVTKAYDGSPPKTGKGAVCTDRDTLEESGVEILVKLGTSGKNDKRKTQYLPYLKRGIERPITPEFNVLVATGRVSSDCQQLPQKGGIREAIVSRGFLRLLAGERVTEDQDSVLLSCDYGGLELRTMAQRAIREKRVGFSKMAEFLNGGKDAHAEFGSVILGISYEEFISRKSELKGTRDVAKMGNFSLGGGAGAAAIAHQAKVKDNIRLCLSLKRATVCGVRKVQARVQGKFKRVCAECIEAARHLKALWLKAWPEQKLLVERAQQLTANEKKVESITFGSNRVRGGCGFTQWLNSPFQGAGGDGCKAAMWNLAQRMYTDRSSPVFGSRIFLNVHDELLVEVPWKRRHEASFEIARVMVETMDTITPDVKNEVEPAIMRRLFKAASKVHDSQGVLRPWWPSDWMWAPDQARMQADLSL